MPASKDGRLLYTPALPSDLPDLKESTNHLAPLRLAHQFVYYYSGKENRYGFEDAPDAPFIRAERSRLRDWLLTNLPVQWGKIVTDIEHNEDGVAVHFKDGTIAKGDMLVGADGVHSVVVPLTAIVGELTLSGPAFTRQLALGHSAYNLVNPELGFIAFVGLHHALPDGKSGRFYWMFMQPEESPTTTTPATVPANISGSAQWLQTASQQAKLNHVLHTTTPLPPSLREIFTLTPVTGVRAEQHIWRDLELAPGSLPAERVVLLGDAAHAMTPSRGEGAFHAFLDAINLSKLLRVLKEGSKYKDVGTSVKERV
ncbi:hypothetical protein N0V88_007751 [Collariella sp. IMI 366227]|nr:hypothetical protein N0V88_007751 [Collariella sp. IMI 366227]